MKTAIIAITILVIALSGCITTETTTQQINDPTPTQRIVQTPTSTTTPTATPEKIGTYTNPVEMNNILISDTGVLNIALSIVERGYSVKSMIMSENMFKMNQRLVMSTCLLLCV